MASNVVFAGKGQVWFSGARASRPQSRACPSLLPSRAYRGRFRISGWQTTFTPSDGSSRTPRRIPPLVRGRTSAAKPKRNTLARRFRSGATFGGARSAPTPKTKCTAPSADAPESESGTRRARSARLGDIRRSRRPPPLPLHNRRPDPASGVRARRLKIRRRLGKIGERQIAKREAAT